MDTLEPVMNQHKLVIDPKVIKNDYDSAQKYPIETQLKYQLMFQMSRLTREKGALTHDDRLDALSMGVSYWTQQMAQDADTKINERKNEVIHQQLQDFRDAYHKLHNNQNNATTWI